MKRVAVAIAVLLALAGCSSSTPARTFTGGPVKGTINVDAASSLTEAFTTLKAKFEKAFPGTTVNITFGASSDLETQIAQGAPVDVFASASAKNMAALGSQAVDPVDFVKNTMEIAVPPKNPAHIASVSDLAKPGVKVAVCDPAVPCGAVAATVFANADAAVHPTASLADVKSTLAAVESGEVDAGLVYVTDVRAAGAKVTGIAIPATVNASTTYPIAVLNDSKNVALAKMWVLYVRSPASSAVLTGDGFVLP